MNKQLIFFPMLFLSLLGFSQGIVFETGTWKDILKKAKQTQKPVFVDVYASWCGPCKKMSEDVFTQTTVGKEYNQNYICYRLDAEMGEGPSFAKKFQVKAYPTYLFISPKGTVFYRNSGFMDASRFVNISTSALIERKDPKSIKTWNKEYEDKKKDTIFLKAYLYKRTRLGLPTTTFFDDYLSLLPEVRRVSEHVIPLYNNIIPELTIKSFAFKNLYKNREEFAKINQSTNSWIYQCILNTIPEAVKTKNEQLLSEALSYYDQLPATFRDIVLSKDEIQMMYYSKTGETEKYTQSVVNLGDNNLMLQPVDTIAKKDFANSSKLEMMISFGAFKDSTKIVDLRKTIVNMNRNKVSSKLNSIATELFEKVSDPILLEKAVRWSERSLELKPNDVNFLDTYANLLYKLGKTNEAISVEEKALNLSTDAASTITDQIKETLRKMKAGEKTWEKKAANSEGSIFK